MKKGQVTPGKGIDSLYYMTSPVTRQDRRLFWKQHRTAEETEIREQLAEMSSPSGDSSVCHCHICDRRGEDRAIQLLRMLAGVFSNDPK